MKKINVTLSPEFKSQTIRAVTAILLFIITYVVLLILALGLTVLCFAGGILLVTFKISLLTIVLGLGLASLGALILIFLVKFLFKTHKNDRSYLIEISGKDQPQLFELIEDIVLQVGTSFPKRVYLSSEVNASVFYDSNFWSMFLPVKKNLMIGMGLVNSVNQAELKAILAHEFGHFSQRSMKVGSYVYQVNQVISNMLFNNDSFEQVAYKWATISGYFYFFVKIAIKIIQGIQWILRQFYGLVNKQYLGLSREMEFHADEVAAQITGFEPLKTSLMRISFSDSVLESVFDFYNQRISEKIRSKNIFRDHEKALFILAKTNGLTLSGSFPQVTEFDLTRYNKSKLVIKDQWASHPSTIDRISKLEQVGFKVDNLSDASANLLFADLDQIQESLTQIVFDNAPYDSEPELVEEEKFALEFEKNLELNSYPQIFNSYYSDKNPVYFPLEEEEQSPIGEFLSLFSDEKVDWVYTMRALEYDLETLKQIQEGKLKIKTFDYDGQKYQTRKSQELTKKLSLE